AAPPSSPPGRGPGRGGGARRTPAAQRLHLAVPPQSHAPGVQLAALEHVLHAVLLASGHRSPAVAASAAGWSPTLSASLPRSLHAISTAPPSVRSLTGAPWEP